MSAPPSARYSSSHAMPFDAWLTRLSQGSGQGIPLETLVPDCLATPVRLSCAHDACVWETGRYTRALMYRDARLEVLVVGWTAGATTSVHDHADQFCWLQVLDGSLQVQDYRIDGRRKVLVPHGPERMLTPGAIDHRSPGTDAIHRVRTSSAADARALSLHIYAAPIYTCRVYPTEHIRDARTQALTYDATQQN